MSETFALFGMETDQTLQRAGSSQRRSHLEIRMDILACLRAGIDKPTQVMYKANLSWTALKDHVEALKGSGLLAAVEHGNRTRYALSEKGASVLAAYRKLVEDISTLTEKKSVQY
jgi:predicted transcriptional regulator